MAEPVNELQQLIDSQLQNDQVYDKIRNIITDYFASRENVSEANQPAPKVIQQLVAYLNRQTSNGQLEPSRANPVAPDVQYLSVQLLPGRAFVGVGIEQAFEPQQGVALEPPLVVVQLHLGDERLESQAVQLTEHPSFDETFHFRLCGPNPGSDNDEVKAKIVDDLLQRQNCPLHIVVLRVDPGPDGTRELLASHELDWKRILSRPAGASVAVELTGSGVAGKSSLIVGILDLKLSFTPPLCSERSHRPFVSQGAVEGVIERELRTESEQHRRFFQYSKVWWQEYVGLNPDFRYRLVKIFAENEWGENRPACSFVVPLKAGRMIDTPQAAARFVSLIPYVREESVGGGRLEMWQSLHAFLSVGRGDCEDHAILLTSLLLGFGMNAFTCIGTVVDGGKEKDHTWVATLTKNGLVTFWESLTGQQISEPQKTPQHDKMNGHCYLKIHCMFNNKALFANRQLKDDVVGASFDLHNTSHWKPMDTRMLDRLKHQRHVPLKPSTIDANQVADAVQEAVKGMISSYRSLKLSLSTKWDNEFAYYLSPALASYESERLTGVSFDDNQFQDVIKRHVPAKFTFKGSPMMFNNCSPQAIFEEITSTRIAADILQTRGERATFALRCRVFTFPENVCAIWLMLTVTYQP